jgi:hypothetical protein
MRKAPLIFLSLALVGTIASFIAPWHQPVEPEEWDDGEHIWGRNVFDTSTFVSDLGEDYPEDADGVKLRQLAFWATTAGLTLSIASLVFAAWDRRGWCLGLGWPAFLLIAGGAGAMVGGLMFELNDIKDLSPSYGLFAAGGGVLYLFVGNILGSWLGVRKSVV